MAAFDKIMTDPVFGEWRRCADRMPPEKQPVIVYGVGLSCDFPGDMDVMQLSRATNGELLWWSEGDGSHSLDLVEWWMPLPPSPA